MTAALPSRSCVLLQVGGIVMGLGILAFAPPAQGRMLLVPGTDAAAARLVPLVLGAGALLVGPGPLPRSYVVIGDRARLAAGLNGQAIVTLAAPPAGCGDGTA